MHIGYGRQRRKEARTNVGGITTRVRGCVRSHQETVLERLEAGVASPLRVGRRDAPGVGHVLQERREVVHLHFWGQREEERRQSSVRGSNNSFVNKSWSF